MPGRRGLSLAAGPHRPSYLCSLVPKLLFGNALLRNSVSRLGQLAKRPSTAKQSFADARSQTGVWEREEKFNVPSLRYAPLHQDLREGLGARQVTEDVGGRPGFHFREEPVAAVLTGKVVPGAVANHRVCGQKIL